MAQEKVVPGQLEVGWQPAASRPKLWWFAAAGLVIGAIWLIAHYR
jgi:hypothetical protein